MSIEQLKRTLIQQETKDRQKSFLIASLAYISFIIMLILSISLWTLIFDGMDIVSYINVNYTRYSIYINIAFILVAAGFILSLLYHVQKYNYRKNEISRLIKYLNQGSKAHTLKVLTKYKLNGAFFGKTLKLFPVKTLYVILDKDNRPFKFPLSSSYIPQIENVLIKGYR